MNMKQSCPEGPAPFGRRSRPWLREREGPAGRWPGDCKLACRGDRPAASGRDSSEGAYRPKGAGLPARFAGFIRNFAV